MSAQVRWLSSAQADLAEIVEFVAMDDAVAAAGVLAALEEAAEHLASAPRKGRIVPELARLGVRQYRELVVSRWRLVYELEARDVLVHAIIDASRDLDAVFRLRLLRRT